MTFEDATISRFMDCKACNDILYMVSIDPPPNKDEDSTQVFVHHGNGKDVEKNGNDDQAYSVQFQELNPGSVYKISVLTTYDGKEVAEQQLEMR